MNDVSPELLGAIQKDFNSLVSKNKRIKSLMKKATAGKASYVNANSFARELGKMLSQAMSNNISAETLPDGKLYWNIAQAVIDPMLRQGHGMTADYVALVQKAVNDQAKISLAVQKPEYNKDRADGILNKLANAENYDDIKWLIEDDSYLQNFLEADIDEAIEKNADLAWQAGSSPKIVRIYHEGDKYCPWCAGLAGTYDYPCDREVYARHRDCHCVVEYQVGKFRQDAHTKKIAYRGDVNKLSTAKGLSLKEQEMLEKMRKQRR